MQGRTAFKSSRWAKWPRVSPAAFWRRSISESLRDAVREALPETDLGELESIKTLPGMVRAAVSTLDKVWRADIDLSSSSHPRLKALAALEENVLRRLPPSMKKPRVLVDLARGRIAHAAAVLGPIEIHGHSEMPLCWRPLLFALSNSVPVTWIAGPRSVPEWLVGKNIEIQRTAPNKATPELYSCATPQHEVLEAFRWMRALLAEGKARPEEIAIAAASPADFDDHMLALSQDANLPIHFVQGVKAVTTADGQTAAALADVLVKGNLAGARPTPTASIARYASNRRSAAGLAARSPDRCPTLYCQALGTGFRRSGAG